eukprot:Gregarina_sp_Poly_1__2467@NODE_1669_length_3571_cov_52_879566_g150_i1_p1_GENE_NODE_1669_length_3571_cov_52_879566_g150_i1NODE_1669_length_3571_cov_52_879566_g150_i1_p1_ORF_typecomplete_len835_score128_69_NODE_1669_length_3571_cov_52_879566_g150_i15003004
MLLQRLFWSLVSRLEGLLWKEIVFRAVKPPSIAIVNADVDAYDIDLKGSRDELLSAVSPSPSPSRLPSPARGDTPTPRFSNRTTDGRNWPLWTLCVSPSLGNGGDVQAPHSSRRSRGDGGSGDSSDGARAIVHKSILSRPLLAPTVLSLLYDWETQESLPCLTGQLPTIESHPHMTEELLAIAACGDAHTRQTIATAAASYRLRWESAIHKAAASGIPQLCVSGWPWTTTTMQAAYRCYSREGRNFAPRHDTLAKLLSALGLTNEQFSPEERASLSQSPDAIVAKYHARAVIFQHSFLDVLEQMCVGSDVSLQILGHVDYPNAFMKHSTLPRLKSLRSPSRFVIRTGLQMLRVIICIGAPNATGFSLSCGIHRRLAWPLLCAASDTHSGSRTQSSTQADSSCCTSTPSPGDTHTTQEDSRSGGRDRDGAECESLQEYSCEYVAELFQKALRRDRWGVSSMNAQNVFIQANARDPFTSLLFSCKFHSTRLEENVAIDGENILIKNLRIFTWHPSRILPLDIVLDGSRHTQPWPWQNELPGRMRCGRLVGLPSQVFDPRWPFFLSGLLCYASHWLSNSGPSPTSEPSPSPLSDGHTVGNENRSSSGATQVVGLDWFRFPHQQNASLRRRRDSGSGPRWSGDGLPRTDTAPLPARRLVVSVPPSPTGYSTPVDSPPRRLYDQVRQQEEEKRTTPTAISAVSTSAISTSAVSSFVHPLPGSAAGSAESSAPAASSVFEDFNFTATRLLANNSLPTVQEDRLTEFATRLASDRPFASPSSHPCPSLSLSASGVQTHLSPAVPSLSPSSRSALSPRALRFGGSHSSKSNIGMDDNAAPQR